MTAPATPPFFLWELFEQFRRRGFAIGLAEYEAVRQALRAGHGWSSRDELRAVCTALWATSPEEQAVVATLFERRVPGDWQLPAGPPDRGGPAPPPDPGGTGPAGAQPLPREEEPAAAGEPDRPAVTAAGALPQLPSDDADLPRYRHVFLPQFPVGSRTVAQAWRRLRRPVREGPATELDVEATIRRRTERGVAVPPVLRPRQRNRARLLLLMDRQGSMTPFHAYADQVAATIADDGGLRQIATFYFHDVPLEGADHALLDLLDDRLYPALDPILERIPPLTDGILMADPHLTEPVDAAEALARHAPHAAVVILSDAGAARRHYDPVRLLDTVAFVKGLRRFGSPVAWLNPAPYEWWRASTAAQVARHVPMFPMTADGMHRAVDVLRGQPATVAKPVLNEMRAG